MLFGALSLSPAFAATPELTVSSATAGPGESIQLEVSFSGNPGVAGWSAQVVYDEDVLQMDAIRGGAAFSALTTVGEPASGMALGFTGGESVSVDGVLFTIDFTVKEDARGGRSTVTLSDLTFSDDGLAQYDVSVNAGAVTVVKSGLAADEAPDAGEQAESGGEAAARDAGTAVREEFDDEWTVEKGVVWDVEGRNTILSLTVREGGVVSAGEIYVDCAFDENGRLDPATGTQMQSLTAGSYHNVVLIGGETSETAAAQQPGTEELPAADESAEAGTDEGNGGFTVPIVIAVVAAAAIALVLFLSKKKKVSDGRGE